MQLKKKATSSDVAWFAGVSQSTVSRALSNSSQVSKATRDKIKKVAKKLNYTVDKSASNLRSQQSNTIALLFFKDRTNDDCVINPFFLAILSSITNACADNGYDLLLSFQQSSSNWHADYNVSNKADGIILLGYGDYEILEKKLVRLVEQGTNFVCWGSLIGDLPIASISCDNLQGSQMITEHVIKHGKKNIAFLGGNTYHEPEFFDRYKGYCQALNKHKLVINNRLQLNAQYTEQSGYEATIKLLQSGEPFDAICAACDLIAIGAMRALQEHDIVIPEQVAVVGFDDIPIANCTFPPLTTVKQDTKLAGELLVNALLAQINGNDVCSELIQPSLVIRKSCHK